MSAIAAHTQVQLPQDVIAQMEAELAVVISDKVLPYRDTDELPLFLRNTRETSN